MRRSRLKEVYLIKLISATMKNTAADLFMQTNTLSWFINNAKQMRKYQNKFIRHYAHTSRINC